MSQVIHKLLGLSHVDDADVRILNNGKESAQEAVKMAQVLLDK